MKRLITIILILALTVPAAAMADLPDITELSIEELTELGHLIQERLFSRQLIDGITVHQGTYIIGADIPAGTYRVEITGIGGYYDLYEYDGGRKIATGLTGSTYDVYDIGKLELKEGNVLLFRNSTFIFYPYSGVFY